MARKYVACADWEGDISYYGIGDTHEEALGEFLTSGDFAGHCDDLDVPDGEEVEIGVFELISPDMEEWDDEEFDPDWAWAIGKRVNTKFEKCKV